MEYAPDDLTPRERYKVLTGFVLPRPIAWVTTVGPTGVVNAAPFSFFNVFCEDPRSACSRSTCGQTAASRTRWSTSSVAGSSWSTSPTSRWRAPCTNSSGDFPADIGEPGYLGLKLSPSTKVAVPRLADAPWAMECKTWKTIDVNGDRQLIMGEGIHFHIRDELWDATTMRVHMDRYHPVGRMFADRYCRTDDRIVFPPAAGATGA